AGRPAAKSLGGGTGEQVHRGGRGRRPREGNDERVNDLNGQGNDQAMGANEGNLLPAMLAHVSNRGNVENQNGNMINENVHENIRNVIVNGNRVGCSYKEFLACNPKEYDGKGGVVVLTCWIKKMEYVHDMSGCSINQKVKYTAGSFVGKALTWWNSQIRTLSQEVAVSMSWNDFKFMMIEEFCPSHEMQNLESELWNHTTVGAGHASYTNRFHELARLVPYLVTQESRMIERYVYDLALQICEMVAATELETIQKAVQISGSLTDEAIRNGSIKKVEKRGNVGEPRKDKNGRDDNKRTRTGNAFATTINPVGRENTGTWPKCTTCNSYHAPGGPYRTCNNCNCPGHLAKDCRGVPRNVNPVNARNPTIKACYECISIDHVRVMETKGTRLGSELSAIETPLSLAFVPYSFTIYIRQATAVLNCSVVVESDNGGDCVCGHDWWCDGYGLFSEAMIIGAEQSIVPPPDPYSATIQFGGVTNNALADLGASISLISYTMYEKLGLGEPKPTRMSLELANRSIQYPRGIVENVLIKVDKFVLPIDFVILDMLEDSRVPIILGRPFLERARAMIDVFNKKITLRVGDDEVVFDMDQSIKRPPNEDDECYGINDLDDTINMETQELLANDKSDSFLLKRLDKSINQSDLESFESLGNKSDNDSDLEKPIWRIDSSNTPYSVAQETARPDGVEREHLYSASANEIDEKKPELKNLPLHLEYAYLHDDKSFPIIISSKLSEKDKMLLLQVLEKHKGAIAWKMSDIKGISSSFCTHKILMEDDFKPVIQPQRRLYPKVQDVVKNEIVCGRMPFGLCNTPVTFQTCMTAIFHDMVEDFMEVFMDDFSVFGNSFNCCLANLDRMLARCEETNLVLNWEKCHFMVKDGIVLGYKILRAGIGVDRAKIDVIAKLPYPTNVKGVRSFLGHAGFYRRTTNRWKIQTIYYASKTLNNAQEHYTIAVVFSFDKFRPYLILSKTIVYIDDSALKCLFSQQNAKPRLIRWVLLLQGFDIEIKEKKGEENLAADHLSRLENPDLGAFTEE
ncbi:reverse transcriptase domain-containing protein, partial [Tanacetum coccineum]